MQKAGETPVEEGGEQDAAAAVRKLSSSRTVAMSALWNLVGRAGPLVVAVLCTPQLVHRLGPSRWGVFTIALSLVGIFSIFDFGIGRSLTRTIAELLAEDRAREAADVARSGILALTVLGTIGGLVMASVAHFWVYSVIPHALQHEVLYALLVLCLSAPLVILNSALWGVIAAYQEFRSANLVNVPIMAMYYIGPLLMLHFYDSLVGVIATLVMCRVVMTIAYWRICVRAMPELKTAKSSMATLKPVLQMGGWMTASNLTFPLLTYMDRFIIASVSTTAAIGYYSTPSDLVQRFNLLPIAIMNTAYPAMAASYRTDPENTRALFRRGMLTVGAGLFPACLVCVALSHWVLTLWLGADFAGHAAVVLKWLGVGILLSSIDNVVAGLLDSIGKAKVNTIFSFGEIVVYLPLLAFLVRQQGIEGAAIAWAIRCILDLGVRLWIVQRFYQPARQAVVQVWPFLLGMTATLVAAAMAEGSAFAPYVSAAGVLLFVVLLWGALSADERTKLSLQAGRLLPLLSGASR
ncbi:flippase [Acidipila sp. EB88]|uniref:flippase n=1 Tax=Acidipila sp. EB88 TaxID=2305226 RepID=UPI00131563CE|nr:flippase [Acidipila sp. EB88]